MEMCSKPGGKLVLFWLVPNHQNDWYCAVILSGCLFRIRGRTGDAEERRGDEVY